MHRVALASLVFVTCIIAVAADDLSEITMVYPSGHCIPSNTLRMHIVFAQAMERGHVHNAISLHSEDGDRIDGAFLGVELWNPDQTVLTLLFEPGRIKRGVGPNSRIGPVLRPSQNYYIRVSPPLKQAGRFGAIAETEHHFCTSTPLREPLATDEWTTNNVQSGTREPLVVRFGRIMDVGSLAGRLRILRDGQPIQGSLDVSPDGTFATFQPYEPWVSTTHFVSVHQTIEDVAGNRFSASFDAKPGTMRKVTQEGRILFLPAASGVRE